MADCFEMLMNNVCNMNDFIQSRQSVTLKQNNIKFEADVFTWCSDY